MSDLSTVYCGIDPDLHTTGVGMVTDNDDGSMQVYVGVLRVTKQYKEDEAAKRMAEGLTRFFADPVWAMRPMVIAIETQEIVYTARSGANPRDILHLGWVSGAAMAAAQLPSIQLQALFTWRPQKWKGDVPKQIHQARVAGRLGWEIEKVGKPKDGFVRPLQDATEHLTDIKKSDWKHIMDGIGLAMKARQHVLTHRTSPAI